MTVLFVTGTDTGVGKTAVTAALASVAARAGAKVAVVKPAQTGVEPGQAGDLEEIRRLSGVEDVHELARYPDPLAPATAARRVHAAGVSAQAVADAVDGLVRAGREVVLVEGAGGLLVRFDGEGSTLADAASLLGAPVLVVTRAGLGTLNHTALTCEALRTRGLECPGLVVGAWPAEPDLASRCNLEDLPDYTGRPVLGRIPDGAPALDPSVFAARAPTWISTEGLL